MSASPLVTRWTPQARVASRKYGIPVADLLADIQIESSGREGETSSANAGGLTQFIPGTAKEYGVDVRPGHSWSQIEGQAHYLHDLVKQTGSLRNALAAYNAGPGNIGAGLGYADKVLAVAKDYQGIKSPAPAHGSSGKTTTVTTTTPAVGAATVPGSASSSGLDALVAAMASAQRPAVAPVSQPVAPSFSAAPRFAAGFTPSRSLSTLPVSSGQGGLATALAELASTAQKPTTVAGTAQPATTTVKTSSSAGAAGRASSSGGPSAHGGYAYPLSRRGKIIGVPYEGTHTIGNWQSDNAVDIAVPTGTAVRSITDGVVTKISPHPQDGGRFAGDQVTISGPHGGTFYTHLSAFSVKVGEKVRQGQVIGKSGAANGVQHLHIGREKGNPLKEFG